MKLRRKDERCYCFITTQEKDLEYIPRAPPSYPVSMSSLLLASLLAIAILAVYTRRTYRTNPKRLPFPPGPKPYPLLGNVLDMPKTYYWLTFADWAKQYGDIIHMNMLGKHYIILDSFEAVEELLEKRSATYSDRPRMPMVNEL